MTTPLPQARTGYIRGVRGAVITALDAAGTPVVPAVTYGIRTAQQVEASRVDESGESATLRGGDRILARFKEPDTVVGVNLTLQDARFDAHAIQMLAGGSLITVVEGPNTRINGWEAPTIAAQQNPPRFQLDVFAVNHSASGASDGFIRYRFPFCRATFGDETLEDQNWVVPQVHIECAESPAGGGVYRKEFVAVLPPELL